MIIPVAKGAGPVAVESKCFRLPNTAIAGILSDHLKRPPPVLTAWSPSRFSADLGLLISLSVLLVDRYIPGDWF